MLVNYCNKGSQVTQVGSHEIGYSYKPGMSMISLLLHKSEDEC